MARTPASVRHRNPSAQWPGEIADRWGSTGFEILRDGQNNRIATFPTWEQGAAAHIDLLRSKYAGMTLDKAIGKWSGGNNVPDYLARVTRETGLRPDAVISDELLRSPQGMALVKSMAGHEKGPNGEGIPEDAWSKAYAMVYGGEAAPTQTAAAPKPTGGMLDVASLGSEAPKTTSGGLLDGLLNDGNDFRPAMERFGDALSGGAETGAQPEPRKDPLAGDDEQQPALAPALKRQQIDPRQLLAILQSRSRLGTA